MGVVSAVGARTPRQGGRRIERFATELLDDRGQRPINFVVARLAPGVEIEQGTEVDAFARIASSTKDIVAACPTRAIVRRWIHARYS